MLMLRSRGKGCGGLNVHIKRKDRLRLNHRVTSTRQDAGYSSSNLMFTVYANREILLAAELTNHKSGHGHALEARLTFISAQLGQRNRDLLQANVMLRELRNELTD